MILVKLRGGLSNQMFQYAAARRLAAVHGTEVRIDLSWYARIPAGATPRRYELDRLSVAGKPASAWEIVGTEGVRRTPLPRRPLAVARKLRPRYRFVAERHFHFDPAILDLPDDVCLFGYWASERYFADVAPLIHEEFAFSAPPSARNVATLASMADSQSVAVHVRRGDYATNPDVTAIHGLCGLGYYARAAKIIRDRIPAPVFFVFSDDLDWTAQRLRLGGETIYVEHNRGDASPEDLRLMSAASHNIIANSGFSWWGAWLNDNPDKIVCAPARWMADPAYDTSDVLPPSWIRVAN